MGVTKFELDFMDTLKNDVKMLSHALSSNLAHKISDEMFMLIDENEKLALEALTNLGYTKAQAQKALAKASGNTVEDLIRTALSHLFN